MTDETDHEDMQNAVRAAIEQHTGGSYEGQTHEQQHAAELGDRVAEQITEEQERRDPEQPAEPPRKARDDRGRFAPKQQDAAPTAEQPAPVDVNGPPRGWSAETRALWDAVPPRIKAEIHKREADIGKGFQEYGAKLRAHSEIEQLIAPRRQYLERFGFKTDAQAINRLMEISDGFAQNPAGMLAGLAQYFKLTPQQVFGGQGAGQQAPQQQASAQQNVEQIVQERVMQAQARDAVAAYEAKAPPHYQLVKPIMAELLNTGRAMNLEDAYKQACQMHPAVAQWENQRRQEVTTARKLKAAGASLNGAPHGVANGAVRGKPRSEFDDVASDVRAAMGQLS